MLSRSTAILGLLVVLVATSAQGAEKKRVVKKIVAAPLKLVSVEQQIVNRTNAQRARYGLRPLAVCPGLMHSARNHASWMSSRGALQHTSAPVAENIAMGQRSSQEAVSSWMNSSGHRANILNAGYSRIGVAARTSANGSIYWCQQFQR